MTETTSLQFFTEELAEVVAISTEEEKEVVMEAIAIESTIKYFRRLHPQGT